MLREIESEVTAATVRGKLAYCLDAVKHTPLGRFRHPYLTAGGPHTEQYDWDAFFIGVSLAAENSSEAVYLKNWALNFIDHADENGRVAHCLTPDGSHVSSHQMKPFLAQGAYLASKNLGDFSWLANVWDDLVRIVTYRVRELWSEPYQLGMWRNAPESGISTNVAILEYPEATVLAADLNTFLYLECKALSLIATRLDRPSDAANFRERANTIKAAMLRHLWSPYDDIFVNLFTASGRPVRRISYSAFVPLWAGIAPQQEGRRSIECYLLNPEHMSAPWGLRTLSKQDPVYNNVTLGNPNANWQGPVWPIANYMYMHALLRYGFRAEALELAHTISTLVIKDIDASGGMHQNYDPESGEPLASPHFVSWNIVVRNMLYEAEHGINPFAIE